MSHHLQQEYINLLNLAEQQFQLVVSVRLACTLRTQPLDVPDLWIYGKNQLEGSQIQLSVDAADEAAAILEHTIVHSLSLYALSAIKKIIKDPRNHNNKNIVAAFEICRLIRNAYTHDPYNPQWSIDDECRDRLEK